MLEIEIASHTERQDGMKRHSGSQGNLTASSVIAICSFPGWTLLGQHIYVILYQISTI